MKSDDSHFIDDPQFQSILVHILEQLEKGELVDVNAIAAGHPEFAADIQHYLGDRNALRLAVDSIKLMAPTRKPSNTDGFERTIASISNNREFATGQRLKYIGEYEIIDEIARGGMGVVFKARQDRLDRVVALKMILSGKLASDADIQRFHREAQSAGRLQHPNIVAIHEVGEFEQHHYFTMDFVAGQSLADRIRDETLTPTAAAKLLHSTSEAVQYAHTQGVLHRDLKPANVLLSQNGAPKITDFGLAKLMDEVQPTSKARVDLTTTGQILGTPSYMSPEQANGNLSAISPASDVYSLGAILYFCLTGRAPFVGDSPVDTLMQVRNNEPASPRTLNPQIPIDLETICLKCLEKEPQRRYQTAAELGEDLRLFQENRPINARRVGVAGRTIRWCRRNPAVASLLLLVGLLLAIGMMTSSYFAVSENRRAVSEAAARKEANDAREREALLRKLADVSAADALREKNIAVERQKETRKQLYIAQMNQANFSWQQNNVVRTKELVDGQVPEPDQEDLRNFEWYFLNGMLQAQSILDTGNYVRRMAISPDGQMLATLHPEQIQLWNLADNTLITSLEADKDSPTIAKPVFSADGKWLAFAGKNAIVIVYDLKADKNVFEFAMPDGKQCSSLAFDMHCRLLATNALIDSEKSRIECWDLQSGEKRSSIDYAGKITAINFQPNDEVIAGVSTDTKVTRWSIPSGYQLSQWTSVTSPSSIAFNTTGNNVAVGGHGVRVYEPDSGKEIARLPGESTAVLLDIDFHHDGIHIACGGQTQEVLLWNLQTGEITRRFKGHTSRVHAVACHPTLKQIISVEEQRIVRFWDTDHVQGTAAFPGLIADAGHSVFTSDGKTLLTADNVSWNTKVKGAVQIWDVASRGPIARLKDFGQGVADLDLNHDETLLASGSYDGKLVFHDFQTKEKLSDHALNAPILTLDFHPGKNLLAIGIEPVKIDERNSDDNNVIIWDCDQQKVVLRKKCFFSKCTSVEFSPNGDLVAASSWDGVQVFHAGTGQQVHIQPLKYCRFLTFSPDGNYLACTHGSAVSIFETSDFSQVKTISAHAQYVHGLCFNSDGSRLATCGADNTLKIWETETWQPTLSMSSQMVKPLFSPDYQMLISGWENGRLLVRVVESAETAKPKSDKDNLYRYAEDLARLQYWQLALDEFTRVEELEPQSYEQMKIARVALMAGDRDRYRDIVKRAIMYYEQAGIDGDDVRAARWASVAYLTDDFVDHSVMMELASQREWTDPKDTSTNIAMLFYLWRAKKYEELIKQSEKFSAGTNWGIVTGQADLFGAAARFRLARLDEAHGLLSRGLEGLSTSMQPVGEGRLLVEPHIDFFINSLVVRDLAEETAIEAINTAIDDEMSPQTQIASLLTRAKLHQYGGRWQQASDDFEKVNRLKPNDFEVHRDAALTSLLAGKFERYLEHASALESELGDTKSTRLLWSIARICALHPDGINDKKQFAETAAPLLEASGKTHQLIAGLALLYRFGEYDKADEKAKELIRKSQGWGDQCTVHFWNTMIQVRLNNLEAARESFAIADHLMQQNYPAPGFAVTGDYRSTEPPILRQEAEQLLESLRDE